jgi:tol-pal system protein YbgF
MRQIAAGLLAAAVLAGCSLTPDKEDPVQLKLADLDGRVGRIERVVSNQSLIDMAQRLDAAQADVRALRGRVEVLENENEQLRKQQRDMFSDLDRRLASGSGGIVGNGSPAGALAGGAAGSAAGEQAAYTAAFDALKSSNYPVAINGFRSYLQTYPNGSLADNAEYWLGEAYYVTRDYDQAATAFRAVGERWPNSRKAPDALVKLGFTQYEQKRYSEAKATLNDVVRRFPDSDAAKLAAERLRKIPADAR